MGIRFGSQKSGLILILEGGGIKNKDLLGWACTTLGIAGAITNILMIRWCFILWTISNIGWIYLNFKSQMPYQAILFVVFTLLNIYGFLLWGGIIKGFLP